MPPLAAQPARARLAEVLASFSLATDLGVGQPLQHTLRACLLAMDMGHALGLSANEQRTLFDVALLQRIGCTADAHELSAWFDDDLAAHARTFTLDFGRPPEVLIDVVRNAGSGRPLRRRLRTVATALVTGHRAVPALFAASCEIAQRLTERLGFLPPVHQAVAQVFERWDGRGWPTGAHGEEIAVTIRIARLAADAEVFLRLGGPAVATRLIHDRAGTIYDPSIASTFCRLMPRLLASLAVESAWDAVLEREPGPPRMLSPVELETALVTMADFADLKSPWFSGHSRGVSLLAAAAGKDCGLSEDEITVVRLAALVHDVGRAGVPNGIWNKPGRLNDEEWERVRLHPYYTERVLARAPALARLGSVAGLHHERLDGLGYYRGAKGNALPVSARLLAVADVYQALTEPRPHRPALPADAAAAELRASARDGKQDGLVVEAVLAAAGHRPVMQRVWPAGLSDREVEVLRLIAHGYANRQIAERLGISPHTAGHHVRHIYDKIGVSSRAAATLFAIEHGLVPERAP